MMIDGPSSHISATNLVFEMRIKLSLMELQINYRCLINTVSGVKFMVAESGSSSKY